MSYISLMSVVMVMVGLISFFLNKNHLLNSLLSLEVVSLGVYAGMINTLVSFNMDCFFVFYFLVLVVCEGVLGLSLLVMMCFVYGVEHMKGFDSLLC
uniref:NADH dehydrogenase subunit 4L n=1 Tax=Charcotia amundseni TaxID=2259499 RepID=UPI001FF5E973|nr:NADH dehydrogenase subunit 4L [Charcotia amundseni]UIN24687.1 NADH dehydrogenase subunit 4L [Charcotia amundseni]